MKIKIYLNSIFSRLSISFMAVLVPIFVVGMLMYNYGRDAIKKEIINTAISNVSFLKNNMESEIRNVRRLQYDFNNDKLLRTFLNEHMYMPVHEYYITIRDLRQRLLIMKNSNIFIQDVKIYFSDLSISVSTNDFFMNTTADEFNMILDRSGKSGFPVVFENEKLYVYMPFGWSSNYAEKPIYIIEVILSDEAIWNYLAKFGNYQKGNTAMYDHLSNNWILQAGSSIDKASFTQIDESMFADNKSGNEIAAIGSSKYYVTSDYSDYLGFIFLQLDLFDDIFNVPGKYMYFFKLYAILSIIIVFFYSLSTYKFVNYPIKIMLKSFECMEQGDLNTRIRLKAANEFNYLFTAFNKMIFRLNELIDRVYKQELYAKKAEIKQLQMQINPHFLYNSYFILHSMVKEEDLEDALNLSSYMGSYLQYIARNASDEVPLHNEIEHARNYIEIQTFRLSARLSVEFGPLDDKIKYIKVPRMIIQPILENSIVHGMRNKSSGGLIRVYFEGDDTKVVIIIEDNGDSITENDINSLRMKLSMIDKDMETTGLINIHRRIKLRFGHESGLSVARSELGGLKICIYIDFQEESKNVQVVDC